MIENQFSASFAIFCLHPEAAGPLPPYPARFTVAGPHRLPSAARDFNRDQIGKHALSRGVKTPGANPGRRDRQEKAGISRGSRIVRAIRSHFDHLIYDKLLFRVTGQKRARNHRIVGEEDHPAVVSRLA